MSDKQNRGSVLIADDHPIVLSGLEGLLSAAGCFDVVAAYANGGEALHGLRELEPQLAVLDIRMPQLTGVEILERIESEGLRTRVVLLTASATDEQIARAVTHGALPASALVKQGDTVVCFRIEGSKAVRAAVREHIVGGLDGQGGGRRKGRGVERRPGGPRGGFGEVAR